MERLVVLPFTMFCVSESSVSLGGASQLKKPKSEPHPPITSPYLSIYPSFSLVPFAYATVLILFYFWFSKGEEREKRSDHLV